MGSVRCEGVQLWRRATADKGHCSQARLHYLQAASSRALSVLCWEGIHQIYPMGAPAFASLHDCSTVGPIPTTQRTLSARRLTSPPSPADAVKHPSVEGMSLVHAVQLRGLKAENKSVQLWERA